MDLEFWPAESVAADSLLRHPTFDDEGASVVFNLGGWKHVQPSLVLRHPTAQWFLSDEAFSKFIPAIMSAIESSKDNNSAQDLLEHFATNWHRRKQAISHCLLPDQIDCVERFLAGNE